MTDNDALASDYLRRLEAAASELPADRRAELVQEISAHIAEARAHDPGGAGGPGSDLIDVLGRLGSPDDIVRAASETSVPAMASGARAPSGVAPPGDWAFGGRPSATVPYGPGEFGRGEYGSGPAAPGGYRPRGHGPGEYAFGQYAPPGYEHPASASPAHRGPGGLEIAAVVLALGSVLLLPVVRGLGLLAWLVGIVLLWYSPRWRVSDKVLGTVVWPVGLGIAIGFAALVRSHGGPAAARLWLGGFFPFLRICELGLAIAAAIIVAVRLLRHASEPVS
jgi:hypothetical protein